VFKAELKSWKKKTLAIIEISIRDEIIPRITTPNEDTWQTFKNLFEQHIDV
jgi:hypothetical protein